VVKNDSDSTVAATNDQSNVSTRNTACCSAPATPDGKAV
jgi:hypothetical protein